MRPPGTDGQRRARTRPRTRAFGAAAALLVLASVAAAGAVVAQGMFGIAPPLDRAAELSAADCEMLARIPNAPITVATCKAMLGMATGLGAVAADSGAQRAGDGAMTCAQLFAELQATSDIGISRATEMEVDAALADTLALTKRQSGEITAFVAETFAVGVGLGVLGAVTPNFVGAAIAAAWQARAVAFAGSMQAEQGPVNARLTDVTRIAADDLLRSLQANPRMARLGQLAMDKHCDPPDGTRKR